MKKGPLSRVQPFVFKHNPCFFSINIICVSHLTGVQQSLFCLFLVAALFWKSFAGMKGTWLVFIGHWFMGVNDFFALGRKRNTLIYQGIKVHFECSKISEFRKHTHTHTHTHTFIVVIIHLSNIIFSIETASFATSIYHVQVLPHLHLNRSQISTLSQNTKKT